MVGSYDPCGKLVVAINTGLVQMIEVVWKVRVNARSSRACRSDHRPPDHGGDFLHRYPVRKIIFTRSSMVRTRIRLMKFAIRLSIYPK